MDRKVQRVGVGVGAFHNPPRAKYSEETRNLIKVLMEESKLSMMQRKSIQSAVDRGESLPASSRPATSSGAKTQAIFPCYWKKRSQSDIIVSGAYEREQYKRTAPLPIYLALADVVLHLNGDEEQCITLPTEQPMINVKNARPDSCEAANKEMQKRHLACMMAYGRDMPPTPHGPKSLHKARAACALPDDVDPLRDLVEGIRERIEFLNDMEHLGQGKKYRPIIHQEIAQKIRMIESLDRGLPAEIRKDVEHLKYERPPPKPFPMGELEDY